MCQLSDGERTGAVTCICGEDAVATRPGGFMDDNAWRSNSLLPDVPKIKAYR